MGEAGGCRQLVAPRVLAFDAGFQTIISRELRFEEIAAVFTPLAHDGNFRFLLAGTDDLDGELRILDTQAVLAARPDSKRQALAAVGGHAALVERDLHSAV